MEVVLDVRTDFNQALISPERAIVGFTVEWEFENLLHFVEMNQNARLPGDKLNRNGGIPES
jgi:hypothetical protein